MNQYCFANANQFFSDFVAGLYCEFRSALLSLVSRAR